MRLGKSLKNEKIYQLEARDGFDLVSTNDLSSFRTALEGVNPFDVSPGIKLIIDKMEERPKSANPYVAYTNQLNFDVASVADTVDENGNTFLHIAAGEGYTDLIRILLEKGSNVNAYNTQGYTPLHMAALNGRLKAVQLLTKSSADPFLLTRATTEDKECRRTALFLAHSGAHYSVEEFLIRIYEERYPALTSVAAQPSIDGLLGILLGETNLFFELFGAADLATSVLGPLLLSWTRHAMAEKRFLEVGNGVLDHAQKEGLSENLHGVLKGFLSRGVYSSDDQRLTDVIASNDAVDVLQTLFRVNQYSKPVITQLQNRVPEESNCGFLLSELVARLDLEDSIGRYQQKNSKKNKQRCAELKRLHREAVDRIEGKGLAAL